MSNYSHLPYRRGVGIFLINQEGLVFVAKRIDTKAESWQLPQGGIDENEDPQTAVMREMLEEIGTNKATILAVSDEPLTYDLPDEIVPKIWKGQFRGQKQDWFLLRFEGSDQDINIQTEHPEFCEWKWAPIETIEEMIVPFKKELYKNIIKLFKNHLK